MSPDAYFLNHLESKNPWMRLIGIGKSKLFQLAMHDVVMHIEIAYNASRIGTFFHRMTSNRDIRVQLVGKRQFRLQEVLTRRA